MKKIRMFFSVTLLLTAVMAISVVALAQVNKEPRKVSQAVSDWQLPVSTAGLPLKLTPNLQMPASTWQLTQAKLTAWGLPASWLQGEQTLALTGLLLALIL
ncbi:MAG: hypothetical protein HQM06_08185 [Magnetococcales bacterium]|nr:hypothetical protein [Magnetococcales bacterium]